MEYHSTAVSCSTDTPPLSNLFRELSADLDGLQQMLIQSPANLGFPDAGAKHLGVVETLRQLYIRNDPVWVLFNAYPTHRVMRLLLEATSEAKAAVCWLADNPPVGSATEGRNEDYANLCQKLKGGVREWYVFVKVDRLLSNLDDVLPETVH